MMAKKQLEIPFDRNGNPLSYDDRLKVHDYRANYEFVTTMRVVDMSRGRSAANFTLKDEKGIEYNMFMKDMLYLIQNCIIDKGVVSGKWTFVKRGNNYGIMLIE